MDNKEPKKKRGGVSQFLSRFRWLIQAGATLLSNIHLPNLLKGRIYQRQRKGCLRSGTELLFLPCGIGRLPNRLVSGCGGFVKIQFFILYHRIPHIDRSSARAFLSAVFLCPFGWLQELLHKIPTKKLSTKKLKPLTYIKYAVFAFCCRFAANAHYKRCGYGRSFFL